MKYLLFFICIIGLYSCDDATAVSKMEDPAPSQTDGISLSEKFYKEGLKYYENGEVEKAKEAYRKAIDSCKSNNTRVYFKYYTSLIGIHKNKNEYGDALAVLKEYEEKNLEPLDHHKLSIFNIRQYIYLSSGQLNKSLEANQKYYTLSLKANDVDRVITGLLVKNNILFDLGRVDEANSVLDELRKQNDLNADQKQHLAITIGIQKFYQGAFYEAIDYYKTSLSLNKKSKLDGHLNAIAIDYANIAEAYIELKDYNKAQVYLDSFKNVDQKKIENDIRISVFKYELRLARKLDLPNKRIEELIEKTSRDQEVFYQNIFNKDLELLVEEKKMSESLLMAKQKSDLEKLNLRNTSILIASVLIISLLLILFFVFKQKRDHEIKNLKNQQRLLRAQMNPHFIFNVLSSIQNLVRKDAKTASKFITKFSRLLRTVLENSRQNFVPLEDEIEVLKNYLDLQKLRFPDLFDYQIEIDDALEGSMIAIPPMLIQPFVENAIEHGFKGIEGPGLIEIRLTKNKAASNNCINCCIVDNGIGYQMNPTTTKKSASVELISSFIKKATGTAIRISYKDQEKSTGTVINFQIPTN